MLPIKIVFDHRPRKDGTGSFYIQYCYTSTNRILLATNVRIPPKYWNKKLLRISSDLPLSHGVADALNRNLRQLQRNAEDLITNLGDRHAPNQIDLLKSVWHPERCLIDLIEETRKTKGQKNNAAVGSDFFSQLDDYILSKTRKVSMGMIRSYRVMKQRLLAYQKHCKVKISFDSLDYAFYESFVSYLTYDHLHMRTKLTVRGLRKSSIGTSIKQLRIFLKDRAKRKLIPTLDLSDFKILDEVADTIYLTVEEISALYSLDLSSKPEWKQYRDLFVLGCLTGLRFTDFNNLKREDVRDGMLYKKQSKSDHWVVIPLRAEAKKILAERFKNFVPRTSNPELNRYIKKIGQMAGLTTPIRISYKKGNQDVVSVKPKYELITTHTCRRSFCTNEFLAGTPPDLIMKISGHKSSKDFYKYIRISSEEAARQIKAVWEKRGEMSC